MTLETLKQRVRSWLNVKPTTVVPLFSIAVGYRVNTEITDHGVNHDPSDDVTVVCRWWGARVSFGGDATHSLFYNAALFLRVNCPFGVFIGIRWAGRDPNRKEFLHVGLGHKLNGVFAATFRVQSDASAAGGTYGPNVGQSVGWNGGPK